MVTATCIILNHNLIYSTSHPTSLVVYHHHYSQSMSMDRSPLKTANMAPQSGQLRSQQCHDNNLGSSDIWSWTATGKETPFGNHTNQFYLPHGYGYPPWQQSFQGALQCYHHFPLNMTHSSQPISIISQGCPRYEPQWQGYDLHQGGYGGFHMFPLHTFQNQGCHLQVHWEYLQDQWNTIKSIGQCLPALILHLDLVQIHLGDPSLAS